MNDSTDLAIACGADGIHVGQDDAPAQIVRQLAGPDVFIGVSTNTIDEMKQALADGADYVVTPEAKAYALHYELPVVTIGGVSLENIRSLYDEGFRSFAMISAIVGQKDIKGAVEKIRQTLGR